MNIAPHRPNPITDRKGRTIRRSRCSLPSSPRLAYLLSLLLGCDNISIATFLFVPRMFVRRMNRRLDFRSAQLDDSVLATRSRETPSRSIGSTRRRRIDSG